MGCGDIGIETRPRQVTQMSHDVATNTQHIAFMKDAARKLRRDGHLNQLQIALGELADKVEEAAQRLREGGGECRIKLLQDSIAHAHGD
jgi:hypothetical protein